MKRKRTFSVFALLFLLSGFLFYTGSVKHEAVVTPPPVAHALRY